MNDDGISDLGIRCIAYMEGNSHATRNLLPDQFAMNAYKDDLPVYNISYNEGDISTINITQKFTLLR